jgi:molybdopterin-binding protein
VLEKVIWHAVSAKENRHEDHARNRLKRKISEAKKGATTAHIRIDAVGTTVTASITNETSLKVGREAFAIIKSSDVLVGLAD